MFFFFFGSKIEFYTFCNILQYFNINVCLKHFDEYIDGVMGNLKLIVSAYTFTYLFEEFQCNVWKTLKEKATLKYVKIGEHS